MTAATRPGRYLPFEHGEDIADQERALDLFDKVQHLPGMASACDDAVKHWEVVKRFGRIPHRNEALGRRSTPAEIEFRKLPGSGFGS